MKRRQLIILVGIIAAMLALPAIGVTVVSARWLKRARDYREQREQRQVEIEHLKKQIEQARKRADFHHEELRRLLKQEDLRQLLEQFEEPSTNTELDAHLKEQREMLDRIREDLANRSEGGPQDTERDDPTDADKPQR